jgi:TolA-binding protein|tara:strand:- start:222 stop:584 length:363 start_codon:yes stop_codon:yes gene_type:complete
MPMMPPPPDFDDDRSQIHPPVESRVEWPAWVAIGVTLLASAFGIYGSHITAVSQIERLEERVTATEEVQRSTQQLLSEISREITGLRSDVQGLERITQVQLADIQRRMERAEQQVNHRRR